MWGLACRVTSLLGCEHPTLMPPLNTRLNDEHGGQRTLAHRPLRDAPSAVTSDASLRPSSRLK